MIYSWRRIISIETLIEHIKDVFKIHPLLVKGYQKADDNSSLGTILSNHRLLQLQGAYKQHPRRAIKYMLGS
jgi:hypothetical protein